MRSAAFVLFVLGCGSTTSSTASPSVVAAGEVATPAQQAQAPGQGVARPKREVAWPATCNAIARDIEALGREFPQLASFRAIDQDDAYCHLTHDFHTHRATTRGGWSSGVPHPDPDGVWFYVGIYDPNGPHASSQIHTQPGVPNWWIGTRKVMFLMLEGDKTKPAGAAIMKVLEKHGLETRTNEGAMAKSSTGIRLSGWFQPPLKSANAEAIPRLRLVAVIEEEAGDDPASWDGPSARHANERRQLEVALPGLDGSATVHRARSRRHGPHDARDPRAARLTCIVSPVLACTVSSPRMRRADDVRDRERSQRP